MIMNKHGNLKEKSKVLGMHELNNVKLCIFSLKRLEIK